MARPKIQYDTCYILDDYENDVQRTAPIQKGLNDFLDFAALGLGAETGEVLNVIKKITQQGHDFETMRESLIEELGDAFFYYTAILIKADITLEEVIDYNIKKRAQLYPNGFDPNRSINRGR